MIRNSRGEALGFQDQEDLAAFFLHHMTMPQRIKLMTERPLLYARTFTEVAPATISAKVFDALTGQDQVNG